MLHVVRGPDFPLYLGSKLCFHGLLPASAPPTGADAGVVADVVRQCALALWIQVATQPGH